MKTKISRGQIRETKTSFGPTRHVGIARGLAEFRSGRPVVFRAKHSIIAMPIDGCDAPRLNSFSRLSETTPPSLGITGQRARAIGIKTDMALSVDLKSYPTIDEILSIAMHTSISQTPETRVLVPWGRLSVQTSALSLMGVDFASSMAATTAASDAIGRPGLREAVVGDVVTLDAERTTAAKPQPFHCRFIAEMVGAVGIEPTTSPV